MSAAVENAGAPAATEAIVRDSNPPVATPHSASLRAKRRSAVFMRWLRKIHLYVGLWGAALGLLFGATGILLNHRAVLKIPVEKVVQKSAQLALPNHLDRQFETPQGMLLWLQTELQFEAQQARSKAEPARKVTWDDRELLQPARWTFNLNSPNKGVSAEYLVGNRYIKVDTQDATPIGTLTRLHMAVGASAFWVLLADTIAGGLIVLSITGLLLWSRMHTVRLSAVLTALTALSGATWYVWSVT